MVKVKGQSAYNGTALPMMITMQVLVVIIFLAYISSPKSS